MPKPASKLVINLNLLKPQSNPEVLTVKIIHWLLSSGRYLIIIVEAVVLIAFAARFKLDADLASKKEAIEEQIPYIESLKPYEILIRQTQLKLSSIGSIKRNSQDWPKVIKKIADQTPLNVKIISINVVKNIDTTVIHITGQTQINSELNSFMAGLKGEGAFSDVTLASVVLEQGVIRFTIDASAKTISSEAKSL